MQLAHQDKAAPGFDGHVHFRAPSDLMPAVHAVARRRGMTSASWLRSVILDAVARATSSPAADQRDAA
jgi:hypothetical protein